MNNTITLVVHGTFAAKEKWWRLGAEGCDTFADRLEKELSRRGLQKTVWKPALDAGFDYEYLSWSGHNRHRERVRGGRSLGVRLNELAQHVQATAADPLTVNFVAHSHGGNVVLEALRHLNRNTRVGGVVLLGTPLVMVKPAFRIARFVFAMGLLAFLLMLILASPIGVAVLIFDKQLLTDERLLILAYPLILIAYGWIFWVLGALLDLLWALLCRAYQPIAWMRGKATELAYGPAPRNLAKILAGRPILSVTSYNDEADLLLQVGCAPERLYREYAMTLPLAGRVLEFVFVRPFALGALLKATEMFLEVWSLGFSVWRVLVQDFEIARRGYYPAEFLVQRRLDIRPRAAVTSAAALDTGKIHLDVSLGASLQEVIAELRHQVQLRHSTYYEDEATIVQIAEFLTGAEVRGDHATTARPPARKLSTTFWELWLVANVGLVVLITWILGFTDEDVLGRALGLSFIANAIPFAVLGLAYAASFVVRRRAPAKPWKWLCVGWLVGALLLLILALVEPGSA